MQFLVKFNDSRIAYDKKKISLKMLFWSNKKNDSQRKIYVFQPAIIFESLNQMYSVTKR